MSRSQGERNLRLAMERALGDDWMTKTLPELEDLRPRGREGTGNRRRAAWEPIVDRYQVAIWEGAG